MTGPLVLGASSRVGQMLHRLWAQGALDFGGVPVWQYRADASGQADHKIIWDILDGSVPDITHSGVICLAGPTAGPDLGLNRDLALAAAAVAQGAPLLYASTQAVYGPQSGVLTELAACHPGAYGAAKLDAEAGLRACVCSPFGQRTDRGPGVEPRTAGVNGYGGYAKRCRA